MHPTHTSARHARARPGPLNPGALARHHLDVSRAVLRSDRTVAGILGVDPAQISRWRSGRQAPDPVNGDRLAALSVVVELLSRWLEPEVIASWIQSRNAHLQDRSPSFMIRHGRLAQILAAIEAERAGAYA